MIGVVLIMMAAADRIVGSISLVAGLMLKIQAVKEYLVMAAFLKCPKVLPSCYS